MTLYNFSPARVTEEVRESKSKEMDAFWDEVTHNKDAELPLLRVELADTTNPPFFFEDGVALLLSLSKTPEDSNLAASVIAHSDLSDVHPHAYLFQIHALAVQGTNVTKAALHILDDPSFKVYLPEHGAYELDQSACLLEALLPLSNNVWEYAAIERLKAEGNLQAAKSLLLLLYYAQTDDADRAIRSVAGAATTPKEIHDFASVVIKREQAIGTGKRPSKENEASLREQRRKRMFAVSDEAIDDLDTLTEQIAQARTISRE